MPTYNYPNDGKFHTRFSELTRVTDGSLERLIKERCGEIPTFSGNSTSFGSDRHDGLAQYLKENRELPEVFQMYIPERKLAINPDWVEKHLAVEMWPGIVIHGTPDCFGPEWVIDFKTTSRDAKAYTSSPQVTFYAWLLRPYGFTIKKAYYLCEIWDKERTTIYEYDVAEKEITEEKIIAVEAWAKERAHRFKEAYENYEPVWV